MGRGEAGGPVELGARHPGLGGPPALRPPLPAPPLPGLRPRGQLVAALQELSGARRCAWAPRRRHHAPPARAGPGCALPAGAARCRRRCLLRVSARRAPARRPPPPRAPAGPTFPFRRPRLISNSNLSSGGAQPHLAGGVRSPSSVSGFPGSGRHRTFQSPTLVRFAAAFLTPSYPRPPPCLRPQPTLPDSAQVSDPGPGAPWPCLSRSLSRARMPSPDPPSLGALSAPVWALSSLSPCFGLSLHPLFSP